MNGRVHRLLTTDVALDKLAPGRISARGPEQLLRSHHDTVRKPREAAVISGEILGREMPDVVVIRVPDAGPRRASRNLEERLWVRFPAVYRTGAALVLRLPPRSRLRRALLRRANRLAWAATNRRDWEVMLMRYSREFEVQFDPDFEALGVGGTFRGHEGFMEMIERFIEVWGRWEFQTVALIDTGDGHFLSLNRIHVLGGASGVELERDFLQFVTVKNGLIERDREFLSWEKGLRAAGLDPDAIIPALRGHNPPPPRKQVFRTGR